MCVCVSERASERERVFELECTSQYFYTVYIPVGFTYTHWSTDERWSDVFILLRVCVCVCVYMCVLLSRDFAQFLSFFFFLSATVGLTVTP